MFCNNCGNQNPEGSKFCNGCGAPIPPTQSFSEYNSIPQPYDFQAPPPKNTRKAPAIIILIVCVIILVTGIVLGVSLINGTYEGKTKTHTNTTTTQITSEKTTENDKTEAPTQEPDPGASKKIAHGTVNGNIYRNDFADITFTKPDEWKFATDEELAKIIGLSLDDYTEYEQALIEKSSLYDMMATSPSGSPNIMVCFEDLSVSNAQIIDADEYLNQVSIRLNYNQKYDFELSEIYDCNLGGNAYRALTASITKDGITIYQRYYIRKVGKYMCAIAITSSSEADIDKAESMFSNYI